MAKIRFKSIFDRMLFLQCVTVLSLLLILGLGIGYVSRMQSLGMEKDILVEKGQQAARLLETEGSIEAVKPLTEERKLLIQVLYHNETLSAYEDEKWAPLVELPAEKTRSMDVMRRSSVVPEATQRYFMGAKFPVYTVFVRLDEGSREGVLLIHSDISRWNVAFRQIALWTLAICVMAAFVVLFSSYFIAKRIINPFVDMNHIVQCYSKGDFSQRIPVQGKDEASQLGKSFNEMADQLKNLEVTRQSFVANVSHELRSPLTSMKGFLEAMMDGTIPPEEHDHYIEIVLSETRRMTAMVNDLLDLARIESGIITVNYEVFDINELIRRTLITFEARISEKQMELDVRFAAEQTFVYADSNQISQVLRNLIDNAIKYSPEGRTLLVSTYALRKEVYVTIRDTGVGIPAEDVPHIFDRFYKVDGYRTYLSGDARMFLAYAGDSVDIEVVRDGRHILLEDVQKQTYTGMSGESYQGFGLYVGAAQVPATFGTKLQYIWYQAIGFVQQVWFSLAQLVSGGAGMSDLSGPVGIVSTMTQVGTAAEESGGVAAAIWNIAYFAALLAVNLSVMNLLPIPALDGGRIAFLLVDAVCLLLFKRKIPEKYQAAVNMVFFVALMGFMLFITFQDVFRLFR